MIISRSAEKRISPNFVYNENLNKGCFRQDQNSHSYKFEEYEVIDMEVVQ